MLRCLVCLLYKRDVITSSHTTVNILKSIWNILCVDTTVYALMSNERNLQWCWSSITDICGFRTFQGTKMFLSTFPRCRCDRIWLGDVTKLQNHDIWCHFTIYNITWDDLFLRLEFKKNSSKINILRNILRATLNEIESPISLNIYKQLSLTFGNLNSIIQPRWLVRLSLQIEA